MAAAIRSELPLSPRRSGNAVRGGRSFGSRHRQHASCDACGGTLTWGTCEWLVAPYGEVAWVRNARAAARVTLNRGRRSQTVRLVTAEGDEAGRILKRYVTDVPIARPFFDARPDSPVDAFIAEADRHPVFRLME
jgi:hypothetical protein